MPILPANRERYPKDWARRSYFVRFVRARGRCEWCGAVHLSIAERAAGRFIAGPFPSYQAAKQELAERYAARFGVEGDEPCPWSIVVLTTAHVFDDRPEAASLLNLAALCQRCHLRHDAGQHTRNAAEKRRSHRAIGDLFQ